MKRREFIEKVAAGSAIGALPIVGTLTAAGTAGADQDDERGHGDHGEMKASQSAATVSFGQWNMPIDRFPNNSPRLLNNHQLIPSELTIKAGGSVNFIISGFHHVVVYGDGTRPRDINITLTVPTTVQPGPPLIDDPENRVFRGLDPSVLPMLPGSTPPQPLQDRVEVVHFTSPGRYLVICGVLPHFYDPATRKFIMFGYVRVTR